MAPAGAKATSPAIPPTEIEQTAREEIQRRQEAQMMAQGLIENGLKLYYNGQYEEAIAQLEQAVKILPRAKATEMDYNRAVHGLTDSYAHLADVALRADPPSLDKAKTFAQHSLDYDPHNRLALNVMEKVKLAEKTGKPPYETGPIPANTSTEFLAKKEEIKKLFREGPDPAQFGAVRRIRAEVPRRAGD